jgi:hypothetical protein
VGARTSDPDRTQKRVRPHRPGIEESLSSRPPLVGPLHLDHGARDYQRGAHHDRRLPELRDQPDPIAQMFGIGLAFAVLIDATIVRIRSAPTLGTDSSYSSV